MFSFYGIQPPAVSVGFFHGGRSAEGPQLRVQQFELGHMASASDSDDDEAPLPRTLSEQLHAAAHAPNEIIAIVEVCIANKTLYELACVAKDDEAIYEALTQDALTDFWLAQLDRSDEILNQSYKLIPHRADFLTDEQQRHPFEVLMGGVCYTGALQKSLALYYIADALQALRQGTVDVEAVKVFLERAQTTLQSDELAALIDAVSEEDAFKDSVIDFYDALCVPVFDRLDKGILYHDYQSMDLRFKFVFYQVDAGTTLTQPLARDCVERFIALGEQAAHFHGTSGYLLWGEVYRTLAKHAKAMYRAIPKATAAHLFCDGQQSERERFKNLCGFYYASALQCYSTAMVLEEACDALKRNAHYGQAVLTPNNTQCLYSNARSIKALLYGCRGAASAVVGSDQVEAAILTGKKIAEEELEGSYVFVDGDELPVP